MTAHQLPPSIAIFAAGSRGDLQPFLALALGLQLAGYQPTFVSAESEADWVKDHGLRFRGLPANIAAVMNSKEGRAMRKGSNPLKFFIGHMRSGGQLQRIMQQVQSAVVRIADEHEVLIFHPGMIVCSFVAMARGKLGILATPFPVVPTAQYPSILFYRFPTWGGWYNRITHRLFHHLFWQLSRKAIRLSWPAEWAWKPNLSQPAMLQHLQAGMPVLNAYSALLFAHDPAWPGNVISTGSWQINGREYAPPADLTAFLAQGEPPIFLGFGSMQIDEGEAGELINIIRQVVRRTGQKAVVQLKELSESETHILGQENGIWLAGDLPHSWLFPSVSMVVHHGGAGTTAAGLLAGRPTVVVPHNGDQPGWGKRVQELGLGPAPIARARLNAAALEAAIRFCLQPQVRQRAAAFGEAARREGGVAAAVAQIDDWLKRVDRVIARLANR